MAWWRRRVVAPVKRALVAVAARIRPRKHGRGMLIKLYDEVRTCGYDDVQVMWEILQRSEADLAARAPRNTRRSASSSCHGWWLCRTSPAAPLPAGVNREIKSNRWRSQHCITESNSS